jgi:hypothetical protein
MTLRLGDGEGTLLRQQLDGAAKVPKKCGRSPANAQTLGDSGSTHPCAFNSRIRATCIDAGRPCRRHAGPKPSITREGRASTRAEEVQTRAETFRDAYAKWKMPEIAVKHEKLAERLEQAAK